jgi:PAS domain-containing protein
MDDERAPISTARWPGARAWQRFVQAHLHDYNRDATRFWLAIQGAGALALLWALAGLSGRGLNEWWQVLGWTTLAVLAAGFPIQIPRSKHTIATGDVVIFLLLALHGAAAATIAAAIEAFVASRRTSARVSSHLASAAANAAAMAAGGALFELSQGWLAALGVAHAAAHMAALGIAALLHFSISTMALMQVVCLKRGQRLQFDDWLGNTSWVGTLYLISAVLAGVLSLNAQQFGRSAAAVGVGIIALSLLLLRAHFRQQIAEHQAQEARVAAAELEAEQNQKRFHAAFTHASIGMAIVSLEGKVLQVNQALCALVGMSEK